ncbi:hypothetical protein PR048_003044, partial [Dryococelus australis]
MGSYQTHIENSPRLSPDGIGGTCKRTADNQVSQSKDIPDVATLIIYGINSDDGHDLNVIIKARNTNIYLNSIVSGTVLREDVRVEYLVRCSKEHDLFKGNPNSVDHQCSVSDIIEIVLNPTIIKKGKRQFYRLG